MTDIVLFPAQQLAKRTAYTHSTYLTITHAWRSRVHRTEWIPSAEHSGHPPLSTHVRALLPRHAWLCSLWRGRRRAKKKKKKKGSRNHIMHPGRLNELARLASLLSHIFPGLHFHYRRPFFESRNANLPPLPLMNEAKKEGGKREKKICFLVLQLQTSF